jgi:hypothetical protein
MKKGIAKQLIVFERKDLRRMFGGIKVNEIWRKRYNKELMGIKTKEFRNSVSATQYTILKFLFYSNQFLKN